jgi:transposase
MPFVLQTLDKYPRLPASRLYEMIKQRGYPGGADYFRCVVAQHRPRKAAEAYLRLRTLVGEQAQVDWAHFGTITTGTSRRKLFAFVMVLSYSRQVFLRYYLSAAMPSFLRGHVDAFAFFGGVPRTLLYDNLKSAVLERSGDAIRFHPTLLALAGHYHFVPRPVAIGRGNEKGRVERAISYIRSSFFPARTFADLADLNRQAEEWMVGLSAQRRCPEDRQRTVAEVFQEERPKLLGLPATPFPTEELLQAHVGKTPYVRFDLNDYSVPASYARRNLLVSASLGQVRVLDGSVVVASHPRCWDRDKQIESPEHVRELVEFKHKAREHRGMDLLHHAVPSCDQLLRQAAERGTNLGGTTIGLLRLLEAFGAEALERAVAQALASGTPHLRAVHHLLDQERQKTGQPPPVRLVLSDPRLHNQSVKTHCLSAYDELRKNTDEDDNQQSPSC